MTDEKLDAYEAKLRKGGQTSPLGILVFILVLMLVVLVCEGVAWLFWSRLFGP